MPIRAEGFDNECSIRLQVKGADPTTVYGGTFEDYSGY